MLSPWLVWLVPLIGIIPTLFLKKELKGYSSVFFTAISLCFALSMIPLVTGGKALNLSFPWIPTLDLQMGFLLDPLSIFMTNVVAFIGFLVTIYSISYMEKGLERYYPLILLFVGSMILLVLSNNFLQMYVGWELVGICSYSLIGHYYRKEEATKAGIKAFLVTRVGDVALLLGILILFLQTGTFNFMKTASFISKGKVALPALSLTSMLFFGGAVGKSAQLPLHVWLPDAMEGPTTVSALIHAATMVKAGVYLLARTFPLFSSIPLWTNFIMYVGGATAFLAATMALGTYDLKKVLAYSTMSQIGYLFLACGAGSLFASQFHLLSHALFKALLFLSAGCVIHTLGTRDLRKMGGLRFKMPLTFFAFLTGVLSLSGVPPLNGFWSKESIVSAALDFPVPAFLAIITIPLTVLYSFRSLFRVFFGERVKEVHRPSKLMLVPIIVLAVGCLVTGFLGNNLSTYLGMEKPLVALDSTFISLSFLSLGFIPAYYYYYKGIPIPKSKVINELLTQGYYFDRVYKSIFIKGPLALSSLAFRLIEHPIANLNLLGSKIAVRLSDLAFRLVEQEGFDQFNLFTAKLGNKVSKRLRIIQTGVSNINLLFLIGGIIFVLLILLLV